MTAPRAVRLRSCRRRRTGSCSAEFPPPAPAATRHRTPRLRRLPASPGCAAPTGWNSPSWRSRPASSRRQRPRRRPGSGAPASPSNSNRMACRPPTRARPSQHLRRGARRCDSRSGAWRTQSRIGSMIMRFFSPRGAYFVRSDGLAAESNTFLPASAAPLPCDGASGSVTEPLAAGPADALGGRSRPALRPQAPSASVMAASSTSASLVETTFEPRVTIEIPEMRRHPTKIA